jgi:uncharacterized protein
MHWNASLPLKSDFLLKARARAESLAVEARARAESLTVEARARAESLAFEARATARSLATLTTGQHIRLGVTGLSWAGKTIFITALIEHLTKVEGQPLHVRRKILPVFRAYAEGQLIAATPEPQPDYAVPRFAFEDHIAALATRDWPDRTREISEFRLRLSFDPPTGLPSGRQSLTIDIVDYPGEWLLDLPLLTKSFARWSRETFDASESDARAPLAAEWRAAVTDPRAKFNEAKARREAELFTDYLRACRADEYRFSSLPPGRFLVPGDDHLKGSPLLTFAPLPVEEGEKYPSDSFAAMMERRYEAYKAQLVKPFFRNHFARLDRQIVLVDVLAALNAGPAAMRDLETALTDVLAAFRVGRGNLLSALFRPKIDKILFAATKADHVPQTSHDRLEAILKHLTKSAIERGEAVGAEVDVIALAAVRATREVKGGGPGEPAREVLIGTPEARERIENRVFDGTAEVGVHPGELPSDPEAVLRDKPRNYRFVRFRPPFPVRGDKDTLLPPPHIRLDRALQFLLGDRFC